MVKLARTGTQQAAKVLSLPDIEDQIGVGNRDYHYLSQIEIAGGKRIYQHLPDPAYRALGTRRVHCGGKSSAMEEM